MSRADNIKRAKLLRQKKKEREKLMQENDQLARDQKKLLESAYKDGLRVVDRSSFGKKDKISTLLLEMIYPLFYEAKNEEDVSGIVSMGILAWNCGIIKDTRGEKELNVVMKSFKSNKNSEQRELLDHYISIKCTRYKQYLEFIIKFEISFEDDGRLNFTVLTDVTAEMFKNGKKI
jgi:hypothetical protein